MRNVTVVMYHYVRELKSSRYPEIKGLTVEQFKQQLQYIGRHYEVIGVEDMVRAVRNCSELPKNSMLLTFDDGYIDHYESVFPALDELGMSAAFFPVGQSVRENVVLDVNKIHLILSSVPDKKKLIADIFAIMDEHRQRFALEPVEHYLHEDEGKRRFDDADVSLIKRLLQRELPAVLRVIALRQLFKKYVYDDEAVIARELYMNSDQLKHLARRGMYIGSHGWSHCWLNTLTAQEQAKEISLSMEFLKDLGSDPSQWVMCYPYGGYNQTLIETLRSNNCAFALSTRVAVADLDSDDTFAIPRLDTNDLPKIAAAELSGWTSMVSRPR